MVETGIRGQLAKVISRRTSITAETPVVVGSGGLISAVTVASSAIKVMKPVFEDADGAIDRVISGVGMGSYADPSAFEITVLHQEACHIVNPNPRPFAPPHNVGVGSYKAGLLNSQDDPNYITAATAIDQISRALDSRVHDLCRLTCMNLDCGDGGVDALPVACVGASLGDNDWSTESGTGVALLRHGGYSTYRKKQCQN